MHILLNVAMIGSGTELDPYHVNLPTYVILKQDEANRVAVIDVPLSTLGLTEDSLQSETGHDTEGGKLFYALSGENQQTIQKHLDTAYPGRGFKLELVGG